MKSKTIVAAFLLASMLSCAIKRTTGEEMTYFRHLYFSMSDDLAESEDICHVHQVTTEPRIIKAYGGLPIGPDESYIKARVRRFPNSFFFAMTGSCISGDWEIIRKVCPKCRKAEIRWLNSHGQPIPEVTDKPVPENDA